jgi:hypothetical protein
MIMLTNKIDKMSIEFSTVLLKKAMILCESKYMIHIKTGIKFVLKSISLYQDDVIAIKGTQVHTKVDLSREERLKKYENFVEEIFKMYGSSRLQKIKAKYEQQEVGRLCVQLTKDSQFLLSKTGMIPQT